MPLRYDPPPIDGPLLQGELLADIWEHRSLYPPVEHPTNVDIDIASIKHDLMVVMSAACDLEFDFKERFPTGELQEPENLPWEAEKQHKIVPYLQLCDAFYEAGFRAGIDQLMASKIWQRVQTNQDVRYHHLAAAPIGQPVTETLADLYLDFKKTLALPTASVYEALRLGGVRRVAVLPPIYVHDLLQRHGSFHGRIGTPD